MTVLYEQKQSCWRGCTRTALLMWTRIMQMLCKPASLMCFTCCAQRQLAKLRAQDRWANVGLTAEHTTPYSDYDKACGNMNICVCVGVCTDACGTCSMQAEASGTTLRSLCDYTLLAQDDSLPAALRPATLKRKLQLDDVPSAAEVPEAKCQQMPPAQQHTAAEEPPAAGAAACTGPAATQTTAVPPDGHVQDASTGAAAAAREAEAAAGCRLPSAPKPQASSAEAESTEAQMQPPLDAVVPLAHDEAGGQDAAVGISGSGGEAEEAQEVLPEPRAPTGRRLRPATRWQDNDTFDAQCEQRALLRFLHALYTIVTSKTVRSFIWMTAVGPAWW